MNQIGLIIKKKRESRGLSQNQLANKAGISQAALSALESETKNPSIETVFLLAAALNCSVSELIGEDPGAHPVLTPKQKELLDIFVQLNDAGKDLLIAQAVNILQQPALRQEILIASDM